MRIGILGLVLLTACASQPDVLDIGEGRYTLTRDNVRNCPMGSRVEAVQAANQVCDKRGTAIIDSFEDHRQINLINVGCNTSVIFHCGK